MGQAVKGEMAGPTAFDAWAQPDIIAALAGVELCYPSAPEPASVQARPDQRITTGLLAISLQSSAENEEWQLELNECHTAPTNIKNLSNLAFFNFFRYSANTY
jgi:hypothetical protein